MSDVDLLGRMRAEYRSILDRASRLQADAEGRSMTESEGARFEEATREARELSERIVGLEKRLDHDRVVDEARSKGPLGAFPMGAQGDFRDPADGPIREFFAGERRSLDLDFRGLTVGRDARGQVEVRSLLTSTATAPIPVSFRTALYQHLVQNSAIRQVATVLTSSSGEKLILPKTTSHPASGTIVAEGAQINENDPVFGQGTLNAYKYANMIQVSNENLSDSGIDIEGYIAQAMGRSLGLGSGQDLVTGAGGGTKPEGVLVGAGTIAQVVGGTPAANGATYAELVSTYDKIIPPYQNRGTWFVSQGALSRMRALTNSQGTPLFVQSLQSATGDGLFGRPIVVDPAMPAVGVGGTSIAFGDFSTFFIRDVALRFERSIDFAFDHDLVTYRAILRTDGLLLDRTGAIANYKGGTA